MLYTWQDTTVDSQGASRLLSTSIAALAGQNCLATILIWYALLHHSTTFGDMHACLAPGFVVAVASKHRSHWQQRRHEVPSSSYPFSCPREWLPSSLPKHDMNVTCTQKNFDTILIHVPDPSNARVQSLAHCRFTTKWLWQWGTKLTSNRCSWNMSYSLAPHSWVVTLPTLNTMSYSGTSCTGLLAPDAHRVARLFELGFLRWCGPKRRTPLHIRHHGLLQRFQRSSAKAPTGDSLIPMVIVYFQNTSRNPRRYWNPKSLEVEQVWKRTPIS